MVNLLGGEDANSYDANYRRLKCASEAMLARLTGPFGDPIEYLLSTIYELQYMAETSLILYKRRIEPTETFKKMVMCIPRTEGEMSLFTGPATMVLFQVRQWARTPDPRDLPRDAINATWWTWWTSVRQ
jgi:hypothetical protein